MRKHFSLTNLLVSAGAVLMTLALLSFVGLIIYAWVTYGGKPVSEIPAWALWLMWGK